MSSPPDESSSSELHPAARASDVDHRSDGDRPTKRSTASHPPGTVVGTVPARRSLFRGVRRGRWRDVVGRGGHRRRRGRRRPGRHLHRSGVRGVVAAERPVPCRRHAVADHAEHRTVRLDVDVDVRLPVGHDVVDRGARCATLRRGPPPASTGCWRPRPDVCSSSSTYAGSVSSSMSAQRSSKSATLPSGKGVAVPTAASTSTGSRASAEPPAQTAVGAGTHLGVDREHLRVAAGSGDRWCADGSEDVGEGLARDRPLLHPPVVVVDDVQLLAQEQVAVPLGHQVGVPGRRTRSIRRHASTALAPAR